jgi:hypothetical protein
MLLVLIVLKAQQIQAGASWDSVVTMSVAALLLISVAVLLALVISRIIQNRRLKRAHRRGRRRRHQER